MVAIWPVVIMSVVYTVEFMKEKPQIGVEVTNHAPRFHLMKRALIIGASGGIGAAIVDALQMRGWDVTPLSRSADGFDITSEASIAAHFSAIHDKFDLVLVATGALEANGVAPEKSIRGVTSSTMVDQFMINCVGPSLVLKHAIRLLKKDTDAVFAALSARVGSIGDNALGGWYSYRTAKAALNQMIRTAAIELGRTHPKSICVALHPGTVQTNFTEKYLARHPAVPPAEAAQNLVNVFEGLRADQTGCFFDYSGALVPW